LLAHFKTVSHTQNTFLLATHNIYKLNASLNNKPRELGQEEEQEQELDGDSPSQS